MSESDYLEWVKAGKPDEWRDKPKIIIRWWKTDPTLEQRSIIRKFRNIDLLFGFCMGMILTAILFFVLT